MLCSRQLARWQGLKRDYLWIRPRYVFVLGPAALVLVNSSELLRGEKKEIVKSFIFLLFQSNSDFFFLRLHNWHFKGRERDGAEILRILTMSREKKNGKWLACRWGNLEANAVTEQKSCEKVLIMPRHCYQATPSEERAVAGGTIFMSSLSNLDWPYLHLLY